MGEKILLCLFIIVLLVATISFRNRIAAECDDFDRTERALASLKPIVAGNKGGIFYQAWRFDNPHFLWSQYSLTPVHLDPRDSTADSVLTICSINDAEHLTDSLLSTRSILWAGNDGNDVLIFTIPKR